MLETLDDGARPPIEHKVDMGEALRYFRTQGRYDLDLLSSFCDRVCWPLGSGQSLERAG